MKNENELGQAIIYVNDNKCSKKSSKLYSHKRKHKSDINVAQGMESGLPQNNWAECANSS